MSTLVLYTPQNRLLDLAKLHERDFALIRSLQYKIERGQRILFVSEPRPRTRGPRCSFGSSAVATPPCISEEASARRTTRSPWSHRSIDVRRTIGSGPPRTPDTRHHRRFGRARGRSSTWRSMVPAAQASKSSGQSCNPTWPSPGPRSRSVPAGCRSGSWTPIAHRDGSTKCRRSVATGCRGVRCRRDGPLLRSDSVGLSRAPAPPQTSGPALPAQGNVRSVRAAPTTRIGSHGEA
jgi:hypothetical protein